MRQKIGLPVCLIAGPMVLTLLFFGSAAAQKQNPIPAQAEGIRGSEIDVTMLSSQPKLYVSVREPNGLPVTESATVKLSCPLSNVNVSGSTNDTALAEFANIPAGDCFVEVSAPGYQTSRERAVVTQATSSVHQYLYVYLHSSSETASSARTLVPMDVLKEMDVGTEAMRKNRGDDARKHLLKAAQRAPQNADVQYLLGQLESSQNKMDGARARYEQAIALSPAHEHALVALGELQLRNNNAGDASTTFEKAVQANTCRIARTFFWQARICNSGNSQAPSHRCKEPSNLAGTSCPWGMRC
jgi:hypothetical protein